MRAFRADELFADERVMVNLCKPCPHCGDTSTLQLSRFSSPFLIPAGEPGINVPMVIAHLGPPIDGESDETLAAHAGRPRPAIDRRAGSPPPRSTGGSCTRVCRRSTAPSSTTFTGDTNCGWSTLPPPTTNAPTGTRRPSPNNRREPATGLPGVGTATAERRSVRRRTAQASRRVASV
jgi:hypothetical protein